MQLRGPAAQRAAEIRAPLTEILARYPSLNAPAVSNVSTRHMQAMARRANTSARKNSLLGNYLSTR